MPELQDAVRPASVRRDRSAEGRREARRRRDAREQRIVDLLNQGVSMAELAGRDGVTRRRIQILLKTILARRGPQPPVEYLTRETSRLNEAMGVAYGAMADGELDAVDRLVGLVKEMDRFQGFFSGPRRRKNAAAGRRNGNGAANA